MCSSAHTGHMGWGGAVKVEVNAGNAFTMGGNGCSTFGYNVTVGGTFNPQGELHSVGQSGSQARI